MNTLSKIRSFTDKSNNTGIMFLEGPLRKKGKKISHRNLYIIQQFINLTD